MSDEEWVAKVCALAGLRAADITPEIYAATLRLRKVHRYTQWSAEVLRVILRGPPA